MLSSCAPQHIHFCYISGSMSVPMASSMVLVYVGAECGTKVVPIVDWQWADRDGAAIEQLLKSNFVVAGYYGIFYSIPIAPVGSARAKCNSASDIAFSRLNSDFWSQEKATERWVVKRRLIHFDWLPRQRICRAKILFSAHDFHVKNSQRKYIISWISKFQHENNAKCWHWHKYIEQFLVSISQGWTWPKMGSMLFVAVFIALQCATGLANPEAKRLYDDLLSNYNRLIRPVGNNSDRLTVKMGLRLSQLIDVVSISIRVLKKLYVPCHLVPYSTGTCSLLHNVRGISRQHCIMQNSIWSSYKWRWLI